MIIDGDGARDLLSLVVPRRGAVEATGNPFEPYRLVDSGGVIIAPVAAYLGDLRAPYVNNSDLSLFKEFFPREYIRIQFRAEFLNSFNRVQFSGPNTSVTNTSFGVISSQANSPRQIQFGLKIMFWRLRA